jgi:hypothetical protein
MTRLQDFRHLRLVDLRASESSEVAPGSHAAWEYPGRGAVEAGGPGPGKVSAGLVAIEQQLHDEPYFAFPEQQLNRAHDPGLAADLDAIANPKRPLIVQMAGATTSSPRRSS